MSAPFISVIIPVFNRAHCVEHAVASVLRELSPHAPTQVVVVDDASTDGSAELIQGMFGPELQSGHLQLIKLDVNSGVARARNQGIRAATGDWLMFLDSDDSLRAGAGPAIIFTLQSHGDLPMIFFRCVDHNEHLVGHVVSEDILCDAKSYAKHGSLGESLVTVNHAGVCGDFFDEDLSGHESIPLLRILDNTRKPALISTVIARTYETSGADRLSSRQGMRRRASSLARGHRRYIKEFSHLLGFKACAILLMKSMVYEVVAMGQRLTMRGARQ